MSGRITAAELMAKLNADPKFVAQRRRKEEQQRKKIAELREAEEPLVADLRAVGIDVRSAWDLLSRREKEPYVEAFPILLEHLQRPYPDPILDGVARALAHPAARPFWPFLVREYRRQEESLAKDGLASALAAIVDDQLMGELIALARDTTNGPSRLLLLSALERSKLPQAHATLKDLADDPDLVKEIRIILRRLEKRRKVKTSKLEARDMEPPGGSAEASSSFDLEQARPVLLKIAREIRGFGKKEVDHLMSRLEAMLPDEEESWGLRVRFQGQELDLQIALFMDDADAPDLAFYTGPELAETIEKMIETQLD